MRRVDTRCLTFLFFILACSVFGQEESRIRSIRFQGNESFGKSDLLEAIQLKPTNIFSRLIFKKKVNYFSQEQYEADQLNLMRFYQSEGFPHMSVNPLSYQLSGNGKRIRIAYSLVENQPYYFGKITYEEDSFVRTAPMLSRREKRFLSYRIASKEGQRVREAVIRDDQQLLVQEMGDNGFPYASATPILVPDTVLSLAALRWQIKRNHAAFFHVTHVEGESRVKHRHVFRQLEYSVGDVWSQKKLDDTQKQIFSLGVFSVVSVSALLGQGQPDSIPVRVFLKDAPRFSSRFGVGYGHEDRLRAFVELQLLRFPGGISRVVFNARYSFIEPVNVSLKFIQPAFPFKSGNLQLNPYFILQNEPAYELERFGGEVGILHRIGNYLSSNVTLFAEKINLTMSPVELGNDVMDWSGDHGKAGLSSGVIYSSLTPALDPQNGFSASGNVKWNSSLLNGRYPFVRFLGKMTYYNRFSRLLILASKFQLGGIHTVEQGSYIPIDERFFGGGNSSVRGWGRQHLGPANDQGQPVGGRSSMEFSVEPRFQVMNKVVMALFLDGGNVWRNSMDYRFNDLRYAAGFGIRVKTPIGPVGIDCARPIFDVKKSWQFHLNIGNSF